jgi:hypothetical protein
MGKTIDPSTGNVLSLGIAVVSSSWNDRPTLFIYTHTYNIFYIYTHI